MTKDGTYPATKADLEILEERLIEAFTIAVNASEERTKRYFDVKTEDLTHNYRGIFNDRVEQIRDRQADHESRLRLLEKRVGMSA